LNFEVAVVAVTQADDGTLTNVTPYPVLMISDGWSRVGYWDGANAGHLDPTDMAGANGPPIGGFMRFIGGRLWIAQQNRVYASNLTNPFKFTEQKSQAQGGFFVLPDNCTGMGVTPDFRNLLAFTRTTTTSLQAGNISRNTWLTTPGFQTVIFPDIGCVAPRSIVNQYGMTWWYSEGGVIGLDNAKNSYVTSRLHYRDNNMARSKQNISVDTSRIAAGTCENFLLVSVPSGDTENAHTWVLDQSIIDSTEQDISPAWSSIWLGIRPVQWVNGYVDGQLRCFAMSQDYPPAGMSIQSAPGIWEVMTRSITDVGYDKNFATTEKKIFAAMETKFLGDSVEYKRFRYAEIDVDYLEDHVTLTVDYVGRRGGLKRVLDTSLTASTNAFKRDTEYEDDVVLDSWLPQKRVVRTVNESFMSSDPSPGIEGQYTRNQDRAFMLILNWTGKLSFSRLRIYVDTEIDQHDGLDFADELTDRYITLDGDGQVLQTTTSNSTRLNLRSIATLPVFPVRVEEPHYMSNV
jgi:hypothetical protein